VYYLVLSSTPWQPHRGVGLPPGSRSFQDMIAQ
jgi:hypothetical protein